MMNLLLLIHLAATLVMVGLIWFVQVVHYPLFDQVGRADFRRYEEMHQRLTTLVVAPPMLAEAVTSVLLLWLRPTVVPIGAVGIGLLLVGTIWASTFFWQVPAHAKLSRAFDAGTHRRLVRSNWLRTVAWSVRGVLVCWMVSK